MSDQQRWAIPDMPPVTRPHQQPLTGVWVAWYYEGPAPTIVTVHDTEIAALRAAVASCYQQVVFLPFGETLADVVKTP